MTRYMVGTNKRGQSIADMLQIPKNWFWDSGVKNGWPWFVAFRETGVWVPGVDSLFWAFDEIIRMGLLWAMNEDSPDEIYIEMPTANRPEDSYGYPYP